MFVMAIQEPYSPTANNPLCGLALTYAAEETGYTPPTTLSTVAGMNLVGLQWNFSLRTELMLFPFSPSSNILGINLRSLIP